MNSRHTPPYTEGLKFTGNKSKFIGYIIAAISIFFWFSQLYCFLLKPKHLFYFKNYRTKLTKKGKYPCRLANDYEYDYEYDHENVNAWCHDREPCLFLHNQTKCEYLSDKGFKNGDDKVKNFTIFREEFSMKNLLDGLKNSEKWDENSSLEPFQGFFLSKLFFVLSAVSTCRTLNLSVGSFHFNWTSNEKENYKNACIKACCSLVWTSSLILLSVYFFTWCLPFFIGIGGAVVYWWIFGMLGLIVGSVLWWFAANIK